MYSNEVACPLWLVKGLRPWQVMFILVAVDLIQAMLELYVLRKIFKAQWARKFWEWLKRLWGKIQEVFTEDKAGFNLLQGTAKFNQIQEKYRNFYLRIKVEWLAMFILGLSPRIPPLIGPTTIAILIYQIRKPRFGLYWLFLGIFIRVFVLSFGLWAIF